MHTTEKAGKRAAGVEAEFQKICDDILVLMDKNLIESAEGLHEPEIIQFELHRSQRSDRQHRKPKNDTNLAKQSGVSKNTQHNVKLLPWKSNGNLRRSP